MAEPLTVQVSGTPNPNAAKFTMNRLVAAQGKTYRDAATAEPKWAQALLALPGVSQVFGMQQFVTVTKQADADWGVLAPQVERALRGALE